MAPQHLHFLVSPLASYRSARLPDWGGTQTEKTQSETRNERKKGKAAWFPAEEMPLFIQQWADLLCIQLYVSCSLETLDPMTAAEVVCRPT